MKKKKKKYPQKMGKNSALKSGAGFHILDKNKRAKDKLRKEIEEEI